MPKENDNVTKELLEQNKQLLEELKEARQNPTQVELPKMSIWDRIKEYGLFAAIWHLMGYVIGFLIDSIFGD